MCLTQSAGRGLFSQQRQLDVNITIHYSTIMSRFAFNGLGDSAGGQPVGGVTWAGVPPVPGAMPTPMRRPGTSSMAMKVGIGGLKPGKIPGIGVQQSMGSSVMPSMPGGGGGHRGGGGGGGQSFEFAPPAFSNGERYSPGGARPDGRHQILGGISRDSGGLDDYYAMRALPDATPEVRNAAVDALNAEGKTAGFGGYGTEKLGTPVRKYAKGGYLPAGEPGIVADAGTELAVPHDGTQPALLPAVPGAPGGYQFTPSKDVTILPAPVVKQLPQLAADGITPLGNGEAVLNNKYGKGFATNGPVQKHFIDPQTGEQLMPTPGKRMKLLPVPDVVPEGNPMRTVTGTMPGDPRIVSEQIALFNEDRAPQIAAVQGVDPATVAAEQYLNDPNSLIKERMMAPRRRPAITPTMTAPEGNTFGIGAAAAAAAQELTGKSGVGPGGLFTPAQMQRATQHMQRLGSSTRGRRMLGEWQMNQPDSSVTSAEVPGSGGARIPMVGGKPYYGPMLAGLLKGPRITVATAEDGTKFYMQDGKVISPASGIGPDGRPLQKGADKADEETIFRIDEMGEVKFQKVPRTKNGVLHSSLKQAGWARYEDDNGDGVPDAMQTGGKAPAATTTGKAKFNLLMPHLAR